MILRTATYDDWNLLLEWRNDESTRLSSINQEVVSEENHKQWLTNVLEDSKKELYIAEVGNKAVGTARSFYNKEYDCPELSWTIAPNERSKGYGKHLVNLLLQRVKTTSIAIVLRDNAASTRIVTHLGFQLLKENDLQVVYQKKA